MSRSPLWREFESGDGPVLQVLRFLVLAGGVIFLCYTAVLPLSWKHQLLFSAISIGIALCINRSSKSHLGTLTLLLLSVYSTFRYGFWRVGAVFAFLRDPLSNWNALDAVFILLLLAAEFYAFTTLILGYIQVLWPLRRLPMPLPDDPNDWPTVDLLIPTFNEPLAVLRPTAVAAMNIDWPTEKLNVFILDDGNREQVRAFAEEAGIGYIARKDRAHAKAGNINHALRQVSSPYVAVFDCDHVPTRSFLQVTMGWLLRDQKLAMLQTPHHFYSPDPFERNLDQFRSVPPESELYYRVVQDGNDFWNAACFCGSSAVLRRSALDQVGGFAVETLTEDAHTSVRLQMQGWNTAYINIPQAAGLAAVRLSGYIRQRVRWARGMLQVLRLEDPLFVPELSVAQRLCYFHSMGHFLFALPRLIFLVAPLLYLLLGRTTIPGFWVAIVAYALPHLSLSEIATHRIQGKHRHAFWNHVYETVMAPFLLLPTLRTLLSSRSQAFEVTPKGEVVQRSYFDRQIAAPFVLLLGFNIVGVFFALARLLRFPIWHVPAWLSFVDWPAGLYDPHQKGIVAVNLVWVLFNIVILGVATAVARETQQRREAVRLSVTLPSDVILPDGSMLQGLTSDLSIGGVRTRVEGSARIKAGDSVKFVFPLLDGTATIPARALAQDGNELRAQFDTLSLQEDEALVTLLYSRADSWINWNKHPQPVHPVRSLGRLLRLSMVGLGLGGRRRRNSSLATTTAPLLLIAALALTPRSTAQTDTPATPAPQSAAPAAAEPSSSPLPRARIAAVRKPGLATSPTDFAQVWSLADLGAPADLVLRGTGSTERLRFLIARDRLVKVADLKLRYLTSPGLIAGTSNIVVTLNGTIIATLPAGTNSGASTEATIALPPGLIKHENRLSFEFIGHSTTPCDDVANSSVWAQIAPASTIELSGSRLTMTSDLASLPLPFYDQGGSMRPAIPIVFLGQPSPKAMQAAAVVASWFGALASPHSIRFPVSIGTVPMGNTIVLAESRSQIPQSLEDAAMPDAGVSIHANPSDPTASVLILSGGDADQLLTAARALAIHQSTWQGSRVVIRKFVMPASRKPDDAPRWLRTDTVQSFGDTARWQPEGAAPTAESLQTDGSAPVTVSLMLPPDLDFADRENLPLRLDYRYNSVPLGQGSTLQMYVNGAFVSSTPMPHADRASRVLETVVPVPVADLRPFMNDFQFRFAFRGSPSGNCSSQATSNFDGAIVPDSSLDISGISHSAVLPNLQLFANAGFPFTRLADLGETAVVLPDQPTAPELETMLFLMGHFGAQTGYPALRVSVTNAAGMAMDKTRDYLLLGTPQDQPALQPLRDAMPVSFDGTGLHTRNTGSGFSPRDWFSGAAAEEGAELTTAGGVPDAVVEEFNWPSRSSRSVIAVTLRDDGVAQQFMAAFAETAPSDVLAKNVSVLRGSRFTSYQAGGAQYRVGENTWLERLNRALQQFPWIVAVVAAIFCFLIAVLMQARLRRRARVRLQVGE